MTAFRSVHCQGALRRFHSHSILAAVLAPLSDTSVAGTERHSCWISLLGGAVPSWPPAQLCDPARYPIASLAPFVRLSTPTVFTAAASQVSRLLTRPWRQVIR